jgi:GNAT superfamily N-acetyltransferase
VTGTSERAAGPLAAADSRPAAADNPLGVLLNEAAAGRFPPPDGGVTVLPQPSARDAGVISFTAHSVIFTDADPEWVRAQLPPDDLSGPLLPPFLQTICAHTGRRVNNIDVLCVTRPLPGPPSLALTPLPSPAPASPAPSPPASPAPASPALSPPASPALSPPASPASSAGAARLARALRYRDDVRGWEMPGGIVLLGRGVAGRWEISVEVEPEYRGMGLGRDLVTAARHLVPGGEPLWAQIAPGNAASVRAFLAAGYKPVGAEALLPRETGWPTPSQAAPRQALP